MGEERRWKGEGVESEGEGKSGTGRDGREEKWKGEWLRVRGEGRVGRGDEGRPSWEAGGGEGLREKRE